MVDTKKRPEIEPDIRPELGRIEHNVGQDSAEQARYDREFNGIVNNYDQTATKPSGADQSNKNSTRNIDDVDRREESINYNNVGTHPRSRSPLQRVKLWGKKKAAAGTLVLVLSGIGISVPFIGGGLAPFMFVESLTDDLADKIPAYNARGKRISVARLLPNKAAKDVVKGCTTISIRCKGRMIGPKQQARLAKAGIEVSGKKVGPWVVPEKLNFHSNSYTPEEWAKELRGRGAAYRAQLRANNPKFLAYQGSFINRVLVRYGLSKKPKLGTKGSKADRINQLLTRSGTDDPSSLKVRPAVDADGKELPGKFEVVDGNGSVIETYDGKNAAKQATKAQKAITAAKPRAPPGPGVKTLIGAFGVLGAYDVACTVNNMIGAGTVAARIAANSEMVQFSWELFALVHKIKSGDGTAEDFEVIGKILQDADTRKNVVDLAATAKKSKEDDNFEGEVLKPNPNYGETVMDAEPIKMSINGGVAPVTEAQTKASLAFDINTLMKGFGGVSGTLDTAINLGKADSCRFVQNWLVRGISIGAAGILAFASGGTSAAAIAATTGVMIASMFVLQKAINASVSGSVIDNNDEGKDKAVVGAQAWTGHASLQSTNSQAVGMIPANANEMAAYQQTRDETYSEIAQLEASDASPLDIANQYSFLGSLSRNFYRQVGFSTSPTKIISSVPSLLTSSFTQNTYADSADPDRYKRCKDKDLLELGIEADVQCNVRYYLPSDLLSKDFDSVAKWMEDKGYVEKDTQTGLPPGYTPPDAREKESELVSAIKGATIGAFKNKDDLVNDYGKFLEYCALRAAPYGKTFEEAGLIGGAGLNGDKWLTGEKCRERNEMLDNFRIYTMDVAFLEDEEYEEDTGSGEPSGEGSDLRVATYNILGAGHTPGDTWKKRADKVISNIENQKIDIIGFQEFQNVQRDYIKRGLTGYGISTNGKKQDGIMWNTAKFKKIGEGTWRSTYFGGAFSEPWVKLKDNSTDQELYFMNIHDPINRGHGDRETRYRNALAHRDTFKKLSSSAPVILTGDFNQGFAKNEGSGALTDKKTGYCVFTTSGFMFHAFDLVSGRQVKCPNSLPKNSGLQSRIDHIYVSKGLSVTKYFDIDRGTKKTAINSPSGSDHPAVIADVTIPGSGSGSGGWPVDPKWYKQDKSKFLAAHSGGGAFTGGYSVDINKPGTSGNDDCGEPVYAMYGGNVTKADLGGGNKGLIITSKVSGGKLVIAYAHGQRSNNKTSYSAGDLIMKIGNSGNPAYNMSCHLHIDMTYNGQGICPQDIFLALGKNEEVVFNDLVRRAKSGCGR